MLVGTTVRRVAIVGGSRIPFARAHGAYARVGNQDMLTASLRGLVAKYARPAAGEKLQEEVRLEWRRILETVTVSTPNPAFDLLMNRWLLYQVLSCRFWARTGFYQSSGAFGFRDQLQDVLALLHTAPQEARGQLLLAASRQFTEGDVQHWWHPPAGRGVRTQCSDDFLWLPLTTARYVTATDDAASTRWARHTSGLE